MSLVFSSSRRRIALLLVAAVTSSATIYAALQSLPSTPPDLSSFVPQGSLLALEAPDFAALLNSWSNSSVERTWIASDNYTSFSQSRLFSRLNEAQQQFATSAGLPPDMQFLEQVAGKQSIFAWYDIGNLEFLYITRMASGAANQTSLLQLHSKFQLRQSGDDSFYLRTQGAPERTVAFAVHGDYLLLATREDLLANALLLMQHPDQASLHNEPWYASLMIAGTSHTFAQPALRMALNLSRIVPTPYFRSYWIQQNITELKHYTAALSDLYLSPKEFREERTLLPVASDGPLPTADLAPLLHVVPANTGVYRAIAHPTTEQALDALNDKLLARTPSSLRDHHIVPPVDLGVQDVGSSTDLDTRIDTPAIPSEPLTASLAPLRSLLDAAPLDALLVYSSTTSPQPVETQQHAEDALFLPIHTAVILSASTPVTPQALESALTTALTARLTVSAATLTWKTINHAGTPYVQLSGLQPLAFSVQANRCILASDPETLLRILAIPGPQALQPLIATTASGFNHTAERPGLTRLSSLLDRTTASTPSDSGSRAFFSRNIASLSQTFESLDSETFTETTQLQPNTTPIVNQRVVYKWRP